MFNTTWVRVPRTMFQDPVVIDGPAEIAGYRVMLHQQAADEGDLERTEAGDLVYEDMLVPAEAVAPEMIRCFLPRSVTLEQARACHDHLVEHGELIAHRRDGDVVTVWRVRRVAALNRKRLADRERKRKTRRARKDDGDPPTTGGVRGRSADVGGVSTDVAGGAGAAPRTTGRGDASSSTSTSRSRQRTVDSRADTHLNGRRAHGGGSGGRAEPAVVSRIARHLHGDDAPDETIARSEEAVRRMLAGGAPPGRGRGARPVPVDPAELEAAVEALRTRYRPRGALDLRAVVTDGDALERTWAAMGVRDELVSLAGQPITDASLDDDAFAAAAVAAAAASAGEQPDDDTVDILDRLPGWQRRYAGERLEELTGGRRC